MGICEIIRYSIEDFTPMVKYLKLIETILLIIVIVISSHGICEIIWYNIEDFIIFMGCVQTYDEIFELSWNILLVIVIVPSSHGDCGQLRYNTNIFTSSLMFFPLRCTFFVLDVKNLKHKKELYFCFTLCLLKKEPVQWCRFRTKPWTPAAHMGSVRVRNQMLR